MIELDDFADVMRVHDGRACIASPMDIACHRQSACADLGGVRPLGICPWQYHGHGEKPSSTIDWPLVESDGRALSVLPGKHVELQSAPTQAAVDTPAPAAAVSSGPSVRSGGHSAGTAAPNARAARRHLLSQTPSRAAHPGEVGTNVLVLTRPFAAYARFPPDFLRHISRLVVSPAVLAGPGADALLAGVSACETVEIIDRVTDGLCALRAIRIAPLARVRTLTELTVVAGARAPVDFSGWTPAMPLRRLTTEGVVAVFPPASAVDRGAHVGVYAYYERARALSTADAVSPPRLARFIADLASAGGVTKLDVNLDPRMQFSPMMCQWAAASGAARDAFAWADTAVAPGRWCAAFWPLPAPPLPPAVDSTPPPPPIPSASSSSTTPQPPTPPSTSPPPPPPPPPPPSQPNPATRPRHPRRLVFLSPWASSAMVYQRAYRWLDVPRLLTFGVSTPASDLPQAAQIAVWDSLWRHVLTPQADGLRTIVVGACTAVDPFTSRALLDVFVRNVLWFVSQFRQNNRRLTVLFEPSPVIRIAILEYAQFFVSTLDKQLLACSQGPQYNRLLQCLLVEGERHLAEGLRYDDPDFKSTYSRLVSGHMRTRRFLHFRSMSGDGEVAFAFANNQQLRLVVPDEATWHEDVDAALWTDSA